MDIDYQKYIPANFPDESRVWIYQSNRAFSVFEENELNGILSNFIAQWNTHGNEVSGFGHLFFNWFIILMADETKFGVSGCSTDSSIRLIKQIENKFNVQLLDRLTPAIIIENKILLRPVPEIKKDLAENKISKNSIYFNNTVLNKKELREKWLLTIEQGWLGKKLQLQLQAH
ncbi:MAG: hypothetical protein ABIY35_02200 [Chitinophagaceae bacterium]